MARTGRFGRQPRSATSLTNTLVAIARDFQNQRASNIMDAWQKGGTFEGKKATDDVVLKFWRDKMAGVSKDDPLFDTYQNASTQLEYRIAESKMTASYATKGKTDSQMVAFYLGWAKKVPKDSEFYRQLQRDAGQYMRTVRANGEAARRQAEENRYQSQQNATRDGKEAAGEFVIDTLRRLAQSGYVNGGIPQAIASPGSGSDLTDFDPNDPNVMLRLIAAITPERDFTQHTFGRPNDKHVGNEDVLYHDDDGKPVTGTGILEQLQKLDPNFKPGTAFNVDFVTGLLDRQMQGLNERIERAKATGHMTDVASLQKSKGYVALLNREVAAYPIQKAYQEARADYDAIIRDKRSSPQAIENAWQAYSATLTGLSKDPRIEADDATRSRLMAEVNGTPGVPTLAESFTGLADKDFAGAASDAAENRANLDFNRAQIDAVAKGQAFWTYGERDKNGVFVPKAGGAEIGAATPDAIGAGGIGAQQVVIPDPLGGRPLTMIVTAVPVYGTARDPRTGDPLLTDGPPQPLAYAYDIPKGNGFETQYGFQTKSGFVFSANPPWDDSLKPTASSKNGNHLEVDFTPVFERMLGEKDPLTGAYTGTINTAANADLGFGFSVKGANVNSKSSTGGTIVFNPQQTAWATDTRNGLGSTDPMTDFNSLTLATLMTDPEGHTILQNLDKNPAFRSQLDSDNYGFAGYMRDDRTGAWVPGQNADQNKLNLAQAQTGMASAAKDAFDFVKSASQSWQRGATGSPYMGGDQKGPGSGPEFTVDGFKKLATDLVKGTPFEGIGKVFQPGTSNFKPPEIDGPKGMEIATGVNLKVPTYTPPPIQGPVAGPVAQQTAQQTGSVAPQPTSSQQQVYGPPGGYGFGKQ